MSCCSVVQKSDTTIFKLLLERKEYKRNSLPKYVIVAFCFLEEPTDPFRPVYYNQINSVEETLMQDFIKKQM